MQQELTRVDNGGHHSGAKSLNLQNSESFWTKEQKMFFDKATIASCLGFKHGCENMILCDQLRISICTPTCVTVYSLTYSCFVPHYDCLLYKLALKTITCDQHCERLTFLNQLRISICMPTWVTVD